MSVDPDYFSDAGGALSPQTWNQLRQVATGYANSVTLQYPPTNFGTNHNDPVHDVTVEWTNDSPIDQKVYGMVTRGGCQITLQARARGYLLTQHGYTLAYGSVPTLTDVSKVGTGVDLALGGILGLGIAYAQAEYRQNSVTMPFMPEQAEWITVEPGETITARVAVRFKSEYWESAAIDGGSAYTKSMVVSGDTRLDLFALPARSVPPQGRVLPTVVGETHAVKVSDPVTVNAVPEVEPGDILVATVVNQADFGSRITAPPGWTLLAGAGLGVWFWNDVHMAVFVKQVTDNEPGSYTFGNGWGAEQIVSLVALRDASPKFADWRFAARMLRPLLVGDDEYPMPAIDADGQLLIGMNYCAYTGIDEILQAKPYQLTRIADIPATHSFFDSGYLNDPPRPTPEFVFRLSDKPMFSGHSITAALLIPGRWA